MEAQFTVTIDTVFDDEKSGLVPVQKRKLLECVFLAMPLEWSWALFFVTVPFRPQRKPAMFASSGSVWTHAVARLFSTAKPQPSHHMWKMPISSRSSVDKVLTALVAELRLKEFVLRDEIVANRNLEFLGMVLDGASGRLRHTHRRCWRLWYVVNALRVLEGHLCDHFGVFPPALSVPEEIFPWSLEHLGRMAPLNHGLLVELCVARALLFEKGSNLWRDLGVTLFCSDASSRRYAFLESRACA